MSKGFCISDHDKYWIKEYILDRKTSNEDLIIGVIMSYIDYDKPKKSVTINEYSYQELKRAIVSARDMMLRNDDNMQIRLKYDTYDKEHTDECCYEFVLTVEKMLILEQL